MGPLLSLSSSSTECGRGLVCVDCVRCVVGGSVLTFTSSSVSARYDTTLTFELLSSSTSGMSGMSSMCAHFVGSGLLGNGSIIACVGGVSFLLAFAFGNPFRGEFIEASRRFRAV